MNRKNTISGIVWAAFFLFAMILDRGNGERASLWPQIISVLGLALSLLSAAASALKWKVSKGEALLPMTQLQAKRFALAFFLLAAWILLMNVTGFLTASILCMAAFNIIYEPLRTGKSFARGVIVAVVFGVGIYGLFAALGISFPRGILI